MADLTVNTDFAQVRSRRKSGQPHAVQLVLSRRSGSSSWRTRGFSPLAVPARRAFGGGGAPVLFYSRQIGLSQGQEVPIDVGGRLTGRVGKFSLGVLNIQTDDSPEAGAVATNFSVVRVRRDLLRRRQRRRALHGAVGLDNGRGVGRNVWGRWDLLVLRQPEHQYLLGEDDDTGAAEGRSQLPRAARLRRRSPWCPTRAPRGGGPLQPRRSGFCAAMISSAPSGRTGSARARRGLP